MRFYTGRHERYCGVDLHARTAYLCILDSEGEVILHRNVKSSPEAFLRAIEPYREGLVVAAECTFTWYWLADLCEREGIAFVLGHALYMKAIHGAKAKNDRLDAYKSASLLRGGNLPEAHAYPARMRSTRDLMRRRLFFVRRRAELLTHLRNSSHQYNLGALPANPAYEGNRASVVQHFPEPAVAASAAADVTVAGCLDEVITQLELEVMRRAKEHDRDAFHRLRSIPGVGKVLATTMLYEIGDIARFPRVQQFSSYARLIAPSHESAGKRLGTGGRKIGNAHLKWAFSEATVLFIRHEPRAKALMSRLERKHGKAKALSVLAHRLGRTVYHLLAREKTFDAERFFAA